MLPLFPVQALCLAKRRKAGGELLLGGHAGDGSQAGGAEARIELWLPASTVSATVTGPRERRRSLAVLKFTLCTARREKAATWS